MSPRIHATLWTAVDDFIDGIIRQEMREDWKRAPACWDPQAHAYVFRGPPADQVGTKAGL